MTYSIYTDHPEAADRKRDSWGLWNEWTKSEAPWTGVNTPDMAVLLAAVAPPEVDIPHEAVAILNDGGHLRPVDTVRVAEVIRDSRVPEIPGYIRKIFDFAAEHGYGVEIVREGYGASISASQYLATSSSSDDA